MQDGRSLFDSTVVWNRQEWCVDETMGQLIGSAQIRSCIVVGIWNGEVTRHCEYAPQKPIMALSKSEKDTLLFARRPGGGLVFKCQPKADDYLKFIVKELKPKIDSLFHTLPGPQNTFIAGSSMGGLISLYALCEYPQIFGGAACLSTHWPLIYRSVNNPFPEALIRYLQKHLPKPGSHKIYFDYGDQTLDSLYKPLQDKVDGLMKGKGYQPENWITRAFPGEGHSEKAWRKRLSIPILFLLKK